MNSNDWLDNLQALIVRFSYMGIDADIASLTLFDAWALFLYLNRIAES